MAPQGTIMLVLPCVERQTFGKVGATQPAIRANAPCAQGETVRAPTGQAFLVLGPQQTARILLALADLEIAY